MPAPRPLRELAAHVGGEIIGDAGLSISGVNELETAGPDELSFYGSPRYKRAFLDTRAGAVLVGSDAPPRGGITCVRVSSPHLAFARISGLFHRRSKAAPGISPRAHVHPEAEIHPEATVMGGVTLERGARVGARTVLYPGAFIGERVSLGDDCLVYPNVVVREGCVIGARVILHASCVIGADGFGFALDLEVPEHVKVPQVGIVRIEDDVEVGACSCIDRATLGETVIGKGTKIDNLVQIAHNVKVGPMTIICAQVGVAGSSEIGTGVVLAGQVGLVGHIRVGDGAKIGAQSGVAQSVNDGAVMSGHPAMEHRAWLKSSAAFGRLADLVREVRELRKRVDELSNGEKR